MNKRKSEGLCRHPCRVIARKKTWEGTSSRGEWSSCSEIWFHAHGCIHHSGCDKIVIPLNHPDPEKSHTAEMMHEIALFPCCLLESEKKKAETAMDSFDGYRHYKVQDQFEPRVHGLTSSTGSGYVYHGVRMASTPLKRTPFIQNLAKKYAKMFGISEWGIGVDLVQYRDGQDSIGWHADDNQGETLVFCVIVKLEGTRKVEVRTNNMIGGKSKRCAGYEHIQLYLESGDGYVLNEYCQKYYAHCLPKAKSNHSPRWVMVFRDGRKVMDVVDNGHPFNKDLACLKSFRMVTHPALSVRESLFPPEPFCSLQLTKDNKSIFRRFDVNTQMHSSWPTHETSLKFLFAADLQKEKILFQVSWKKECEDKIKEFSDIDFQRLSSSSPELQGVRYGHPSFSHLIREGEIVKSRSILRSTGCLKSAQGGVSGNKECGCDAIVCSGSNRYNANVKYPWSELNMANAEEVMDTIYYSAFTRNGALAILNNFDRGLPIRVFRSSNLEDILSCPKANFQSSGQSYRYDGLYIVHQVEARCLLKKDEVNSKKYFRVENLDDVRNSKYRKGRNIQVMFILKRCPHFDKANVSSSLHKYLQILPNHVIKLGLDDVYFFMFNKLSTSCLLNAASIQSRQP